jgi:hypothetical protein
MEVSGSEVVAHASKRRNREGLDLSTPDIPKPHWTEALIMLEISEQQIESAPKISHVLKAAGMLDNVWDYLEGSAKPQARAILEARSRLNKKQAKEVPFEAFCVAADVSPKDALALLTVEVYDQASKASALLAASQHPNITQATIEAALSPLGTAEKKMLHQHAGFLPVPKTSIVNVHGNHAVIGGEQKNVVLRPVEESVRTLGDRFNSRALPQPAEAIPVLDVEED